MIDYSNRTFGVSIISSFNIILLLVRTFCSVCHNANVYFHCKWFALISPFPRRQKTIHRSFVPTCLSFNLVHDFPSNCKTALYVPADNDIVLFLWCPKLCNFGLNIRFWNSVHIWVSTIDSYADIQYILGSSLNSVDLLRSIVGRGLSVGCGVTVGYGSIRWWPIAKIALIWKIISTIISGRYFHSIYYWVWIPTQVSSSSSFILFFLSVFSHLQSCNNLWIITAPCFCCLEVASPSINTGWAI